MRLSKSRKVVIFCFVTVGVFSWLLIQLSPQFFNSRIERIFEDDLPRISVENGSTVYCRMKADDFRFPIPKGLKILESSISEGGFDTVKGFIRVQKVSGQLMSATEYEQWVQSSLQPGGRITAIDSRDLTCMRIEFEYFGDR